MVWSRGQRVVKIEQFGIRLVRRRVLEVRMTAPMMILGLFWRNEVAEIHEYLRKSPCNTE